MRVKKVLIAMLGLCRETVVRCWELHDGERPRIEVGLGTRVRRRGRCGRCGALAAFYDQGGGVGIPRKGGGIDDEPAGVNGAVVV